MEVARDNNTRDRRRASARPPSLVLDAKTDVEWLVAPSSDRNLSQQESDNEAILWPIDLGRSVAGPEAKIPAKTGGDGESRVRILAEASRILGLLVDLKSKSTLECEGVTILCLFAQHRGSAALVGRLVHLDIRSQHCLPGAQVADNIDIVLLLSVEFEPRVPDKGQCIRERARLLAVGGLLDQRADGREPEPPGELQIERGVLDMTTLASEEARLPPHIGGLVLGDIASLLIRPACDESSNQFGVEGLVETGFRQCLVSCLTGLA